MKTSVSAVLLFVLMGMSTGCVSQQLYDQARTAYLKSQERIAELEAQVADLNEQIRQMQLQGEASSVLVAERDKLAAELAAAQAEIAALRARPVTGNALTPELESALKQFAQRYSHIASFDPVSGAVELKSDLTFALGSAELSAAAGQSLAGLAEILASPDAVKYEIRVVGHTDNVRISRPATRAKHPTNWHLSVHRAIAVRDALEAAGIPAARTSVSGYGEYRPVVANGPRGAAENRRVTIFLAPMATIDPALLKPAAPAAPAAPATTEPAVDTIVPK